MDKESEKEIAQKGPEDYLDEYGGLQQEDKIDIASYKEYAAKQSGINKKIFKRE